MVINTKIMQKTQVSQEDIKQSIRDLTWIHKVPRSKVRSFISWFIRKYKIECSFEMEKQYRRIALEEIDKSEASHDCN
ncbi:hypothetical protein D3C75_797350 [compost metagenome]